MANPFTPPIHRDLRADVEARDTIAGEALTFLAAEPERLRRFLDITGLSPATLRKAAAAPGFAASLLDYIAGDERCMLSFAADCGRDPAAIARLRQALAPRPRVDGGLMSAGFCRDCLRAAPAPAPSRCRACGSPRMVAHAELPALSIAHVDCDAFYASVEKRDRPELRDKAVIIGGGERGVVLTACYNARIHGVRSAMPMFKARKLCPHATIVRPDMAKYAAVGRAVRAMMLDLTPLVQPVSIDEAFLDLSGTQLVHGALPALTLARFARDVERTHGITVSIGLSDAKFLAKLASDLDKPRGFTVIGRAEAAARLRPMKVGAIWGVGAVSQARLANLGFATIGDIQDCTQAEFARRIGSEGSSLWPLAFGIDGRKVSPTREAKSVSSETTFRRDLASADELLPILYHLAEKVAQRLAASELAAGGVVLKLKTSSFRLKTRSRAPIPPTQLAPRLFEAARALLAPELDGTRYRLIGLGTCDLRPAAEADRADLLDVSLERQKAAARAIDAVRARFGQEALVRGITMGREGKR